EPLSRVGAGLGPERRRAGRAAHADRRALRTPLRARRGAAPVLRGKQARRAVRARAADRVADRPRGRGPDPSAAPRAGRSALRPLPRVGRVIEIPVTRLRDDATLPARAYPGDAGLDLVACER